ncbi:MAG: FGGY-family carbohydrate kinase [Opitutaceae bacterium]|jgi:xylulokinase
MEPLLLGIDVGTSSVKAALVDRRGGLHAVGQAEYPLHHIRPAWVEQDPENWWRGTCQAVREALARVPDGGERVLGLAVSCQAPALLALDRSGRALRPAMIWMDRRAEAESSRLAEQIGAAEIHRVTGNRPDALYVAARLLWLRNNEPKTLSRTWQFAQVNGYINYRLTGRLTLDPSNAVLLQMRSYGTGEWSKALCAACGVEPSQFPEVVPAHSAQGEVTRQASEATGLRAGIPVMAGTVDSAAAALEVGVVEPGIAAEMTGTSTVLIVPNDRGLTEPALIAMPHALPGIHLLLGAMVASGGCLRWFRDQFGQPEVRDESEGKGGAFDLLTRQAAGVEPGSGGVIFLPYMMGERSPLWHTHARGVFFGLSLATPRAALVRSILEGTAFALRHNMEVALRAGAEVREVRSVGGCSRSELWNQIKADVLGRPLLLPRTSVGSPFGAAVVAGMGLGIYPDVRKSLSEIVQLDRRFEPDQANHERYMRSYRVYRDIYEHLKGDFDHMASVTP